MTPKQILMDSDLCLYLEAVSLRELPLQKALREETQKRPDAMMQITAVQGQFMHLLVKLMGARRILEIGVFTGYSALAMALAMPEDGKLIACDINPNFTAIALRYFESQGILHKIDLRLAPALETLHALIVDGLEDQFDLCFIDADKIHYGDYYEQALRLIRPGGVILIDNLLWGGKVNDPSWVDQETEALRQMNQRLLKDERIDYSLLPMADGLGMARKR
jgi:predicted O-methyltransferase YrrM